MFKLLLGNTLRIASKTKPIRFIPSFRSFSFNKNKEMSEFYEKNSTISNLNQKGYFDRLHSIYKTKLKNMNKIIARI
jgi:hypothetical protein